MADLTISITGSLGESEVTFASRQYGHAHAIGEAIAYLALLQRDGINADHAAIDDGEEPPKNGWIKKEWQTRALSGD